MRRLIARFAGPRSRSSPRKRAEDIAGGDVVLTGVSGATSAISDSPAVHIDGGDSTCPHNESPVVVGDGPRARANNNPPVVFDDSRLGQVIASPSKIVDGSPVTHVNNRDSTTVVANTPSIPLNVGASAITNNPLGQDEVGHEVVTHENASATDPTSKSLWDRAYEEVEKDEKLRCYLENYKIFLHNQDEQAGTLPATRSPVIRSD